MVSSLGNLQSKSKVKVIEPFSMNSCHQPVHLVMSQNQESAMILVELIGSIYQDIIF